MTNARLKQLAKLLSEFATLIANDNPLAAQVVRLVYKWVDEEIE